MKSSKLHMTVHLPGIKLMVKLIKVAKKQPPIARPVENKNAINKEVCIFVKGQPQGSYKSAARL